MTEPLRRALLVAFFCVGAAGCTHVEPWQRGTLARRDAEKLLGAKIFLQLWVKVKKGWREDDRMLKNIGIMEE